MTASTTPTKQARIAIGSAAAGLAIMIVLSLSFGYQTTKPKPPIECVSNDARWEHGKHFVATVKFQPGDTRFDTFHDATVKYKDDQTKSKSAVAEHANGLDHRANWQLESYAKDPSKRTIKMTFQARCPHTSSHTDGIGSVALIHPLGIGSGPIHGITSDQEIFEVPLKIAELTEF